MRLVVRALNQHLATIGKDSGFRLAAEADIVVHDAQYSEQEYVDHKGWGHSSIAQVVTLARRCAVRCLVLFHHDPFPHWQRLGGPVGGGKVLWGGKRERPGTGIRGNGAGPGLEHSHLYEGERGDDARGQQDRPDEAVRGLVVAVEDGEPVTATFVEVREVVGGAEDVEQHHQAEDPQDQRPEHEEPGSHAPSLGLRGPNVCAFWHIPAPLPN